MIEVVVGLFLDCLLLIVSVWEFGLVMVMAVLCGDFIGFGFIGFSFEEMVTIDCAQRDHAIEVVEIGAWLARERGAWVELLLVVDEVEIVEMIAGVVEQFDVVVVVVGSCGLGVFKLGFFGFILCG